MPISSRQAAVRAYRTAVLPLSRKYGVPALSHDPKLSEVADFHRRPLKKVHPDKGGAPEDFREVRSAKELLDKAMHTAEAAPPPPAPSAPPAKTRKRPSAAPPHAPKKPSSAPAPADASEAPPTSSASVAVSEDLCPFCAETKDGPARSFRIQSSGVLLTYNGLQLAEADTWTAFQTWVQANKKEWNLLCFSQTMELCHRRRR